MTVSRDLVVCARKAEKSVLGNGCELLGLEGPAPGVFVESSILSDVEGVPFLVGDPSRAVVKVVRTGFRGRCIAFVIQISAGVDP